MGRRHTKSRPDPLALSEELLEADDDRLFDSDQESGDGLTRAPEPEDEAPSVPPRKRYAHVGVVLIIVYVLIVNLLAGLTVYFALNEREQALASSQQRAAGMSRVMEEHIARTFGETERVLQAIGEQARRAGGFGVIGETETNRVLLDYQRTLPQSRLLMAIDHEGKAIAATAEKPVRELRVAGEDYFESVPAAPGAYLSRAVKDPFYGRWVIPVSRRVEADFGFPEGVVTAFVDPAYFEALFTELDLPRGTTFSIAHSDGRQLAFFPKAADKIDADLSPTAIFTAPYKSLRAGNFTETGDDGIARLKSFRRLAALPLVVSVAVPQDAALELWQQSATIAGLVAAVLAMFVGILLLLTYHELRRRAESEIALRQSNQELEACIRERTAALEQSNRQLAAFSYSVSHDLRAPLRAINGFCQALAEDYGPVLDKDGNNYLRRVRRASERMGELIDSMVELTSLSRASVHRARSDLSAIARDIAAELAENEPERQVEFDISPDIVTSADSKLVRILLAHLFDNAWKFTRDTADPRISFGTISEGGETIYFVDDNGVGFDMSHAAKLFTPFHRMHPREEFEGFGIGLATAKHIVDMHGGRIWADAVPGRGVVMYFSLRAKGDGSKSRG